jgi:hypothetical protein
MTFLVCDFINAKFRWIQSIRTTNELAQLLHIDPFSRFPVNSRYSSYIPERHHLTQFSNTVLKPLGVEAIFVNEVQFFDTTITAPAFCFPFTEDNIALLHTYRDPCPARIGGFDIGASYATYWAIARLACKVQKTVMLDLSSIASQRL